MRRKGNLYDQVISVENLRKADAIARMGKSRQRAVIRHLEAEEANILALHDMLASGSYRTATYHTFKVYEPKERLVYRLPYFPDRIVHHAIMNILEPIFVANFTADTYSCIKGKGIHGALGSLKRALRDQPGTRYCLKLDIRKFYPSVDHKILKQLLRRKIKDDRLLDLLEEIIDSAEGLPIGNYLSQYFANFYLSGLDHHLKEVLRVKYYFRYADDLVILSPDKPRLHIILAEIRRYLSDRLKLDIKGNYQVFPVHSRGIDFLGYVARHTHVRLRPSIKKNFARAMATKPSRATAASYYGWACHADSNHLLKKLLSNEKFRRLPDRARKERHHRRQNKDRPGAQRSDHHPPLSDRAVQIRGRKGRYADREGQDPVPALVKLQDPDRHDQKGTPGRLSLPGDDSKKRRALHIHIVRGISNHMIHHVDIIQALKTQRFTLENEKTTQMEIRRFLAFKFPNLLVDREYLLDPHNQIDFLLDNRIGLEVKIKGSKREIFRQCERYCDFELVKIFILVTNLTMGFPEEINGRPCYVVKLGQSWL